MTAMFILKDVRNKIHLEKANIQASYLSLISYFSFFISALNIS
jgi:hypothetical protein